MKRFFVLLKREYDVLFLPLCIIIAVLAVSQFILFGIALRSWYFYAPFSHYVNSSRVSAVFLIAFVSLLVLVGVTFIRNYTPSKSIYALLTIPVKRGHVYLAKLAAAGLAGLMLLAVQMVLILLIFAQFQIFGRNAGVRNADLYLSLLDVGFLRLMFPPDLLSLVLMLLGFFGTICITLFIAVKLKCGNVIFSIILAAVWVVLLLRTFPLGEFTLIGNIIALAIMLIIPIFATGRGTTLFESGEVAR